MTPKETAYKKISELVERFEEQYASYKKSEYNETSTRRDFVDPFFKALGWDIDNEQGYAQSYREVIHEDKVRVGKATKAPDYSFRIGGAKRLFFVEAKKPSVFIKDDMLPAYQVRRYGWSAKLSISMITDFEEFAVYDCTKKPLATDKASIARVEYFTFKDYLLKFDFIWDTFSKEAVLKGSFDKYVQGTANKKGTATVDKEFLLSLDKWRTYLATSISLRNKELDEDEINFAVQQTIDRIIFIRIAEGRGIEIDGNLKNALKQGDYYQNLFEIFKIADDKYNSGLFDFKKDQVSKNLKIDNKIIKTIINELYYPESPYEFSVLDVEIIGSAYEQFLGKTITIDKAHHAKIEEKPEVRKAGGVYYTPQFVVDYIVQHTVGKLIENKKPEEVSNIKIVDPACGSGSFLIGAYSYLMHWHIDYYIKKLGVTRGHKMGVLTPDGHLSTAEKKRILINNIYGVDIDVNAVEVTKLSLLLKCMEGETDASISHQFNMFHERVLPTLDNNIKSGNSLIDTDIYGSQLDFCEEKKIKPFNWEKAFPEVFKDRNSILTNDFRERYNRIHKQEKSNEEEYLQLLNKYKDSVNEPSEQFGKKGGFDIVIGNPPYFSLSGIEKNMLTYYIRFYKVFERSTDIYCLFFEKALNILRPNGLVSFITSNQWLQTNYGKILRNYLVEKSNPEILINFGGVKIFQDATVDTSILQVRKAFFNNLLEACHFKSDYQKETPLIDYFERNKVLLTNLENGRWTIAEESKLSLKDKIKTKGNVFKNWNNKIYRGVLTGLNEAFIINEETKQRLIAEDTSAAEIIKPLLRGRDVHKFNKKYANLSLVVSKNGIDINKYPSIKKHLASFGENIKKRADQGENWWNLRACNYYDSFALPKIIYPETTIRRSEFYIDTEGYYIDKTCFMITGENLSFLCGVLASKLIEWYLETELRLLGKNSIQYSKQFIEQIPIPQINERNKALCSEISKLSEQIINTNKEINSLKLASKIEQLQTRIEYFESTLNKNVYELYELTPEEIAIVETSNKQ